MDVRWGIHFNFRMKTGCLEKTRAACLLMPK